jgi:dihydrofolate synthase/folylpolyglutamate synthase
MNGVSVSADVLEEEVDALLAWLETGTIQLTYFEAVTLLAIKLFGAAGVDVAILEVGLGGRLDATNAVEPHVNVITSLALDHTEWLGDTLEQIAWEKGGITRPFTPLVTGMEPRLVPFALKDRHRPDRVSTLGVDFHLEEDGGGMVSCHGSHRVSVSNLGLLGRHQKDNAALAIEAFRLLESPDEKALRNAARGLAKAHHPGRLERLKGAPEVLFDGAHNEGGARALVHYLQENPVEGKTIMLTALKLPREPGSLFPFWTEEVDHWCLVDIPGQPMVSSDILLKSLRDADVLWVGCPTEDNLREALERAAPNGRVVVAGSLYLIGAIRGSLTRLHQPYGSM